MTLSIRTAEHRAICEAIAPERMEQFKRLCVGRAIGHARRALHRVPEGEDRPRIAVETAERWLRGEATQDECRIAGRNAAAYANAAFDAGDPAKEEADRWHAANAASVALGASGSDAARVADWFASDEAGHAAEHQAQDEDLTTLYPEAVTLLRLRERDDALGRLANGVEPSHWLQALELARTLQRRDP